MLSDFAPSGRQDNRRPQTDNSLFPARIDQAHVDHQTRRSHSHNWEALGLEQKAHAGVIREPIINLTRTKYFDILISKRPIWLAEAADPLIAVSPTHPGHRRIATQPLGIVHVLVPGQPAARTPTGVVHPETVVYNCCFRKGRKKTLLEQF
jgi:hypothetical protein